jgi:Fe-S-cluster containining protein
LDFSCIENCSKCCIEREYYPTMKFGKVGVLILPDEKQQIELLAEKNGTKITILPRIGVSEKKSDGPDTILAYQMMGRDPNGNTCPFLDTESSKRSPHGGYTCKIYDTRPLACRAYPVIESTTLSLDSKCKFCESCSTPTGNIDSELESLIKIKDQMKTDAPYIWRYATGVGELQDKDLIENGWFLV